MTPGKRIKMKTVVLTGSQGFIGSYICNELLNNGYRVIGVDNYSKYGYIERPHDTHPNFTLQILDLTKDSILTILSCGHKVDFVIACAAMIGGISYFHKYAYDLVSANEKILANTFDPLITYPITRAIVLSSSMVYETTNKIPSSEDDVSVPLSTYGMQKLMSEYFVKGLWDQYSIPYTIIRPFNCVGVGEDESLKDDKLSANNISFTLSHVLPDLIRKIHSGQTPVEILGSGTQVRCFTNGKDIARGIRLAMESPYAVNQAFNISSSYAVTMIELAQLIWAKLRPSEVFDCKLVSGFPHDVQQRIPDVSKAKRLLNFEAEIGLDESIDEVIKYIV